MRAVIAEALGPPESFKLEERPNLAPGPGHIAISIRAAGVSFVDTLIAAGRYQVRPPLPFTPGSEFSGVVAAVGAGVEGLAVGDRVCASALGGALADLAIVPATAALRLPDDLPFNEAAVFRVSYATAYYALVQRGRLAAGETVLVLGAGGAVGLAAVQIARALGAYVIGSASTQAKRDLARLGGADHVIDAPAADWRRQLSALSPDGVDIVVDPVGGVASEPAFRALAWGGRHLIIGFAAGEIARLPLNLALLKGATLVGVDIRQFGERQPAIAAINIARLFDLYAQGRVRPEVALTYPLERFAEAMNAAASGRLAGRVVVEIG
jgi:NADPH2:quinone reductase